MNSLKAGRAARTYAIAAAITSVLDAATGMTTARAQSASAQEPPELGRIVVTARNREEAAQDIPLPVQVLGGDQLERDGVQSIWDLPEKAPNLQLNPPGENARKVSPSIRGVGRNGANDSAEGSVGTIVDGVTLYYSGQAWNDYVDLDRVEVLRGPQGTLMGKNTTLGAINILTKPPSFTPSSSFEVASGNLNSLKGKFSSTGGVIDDKLAWRGSFVVDRVNGLYTNSYQSFGKSKETWNESNRIGARVQLLATPTQNVTNRLIVDKLRSDERTNLGFQWDDGPATWADGTPRSTSYLRKFAERSQWFRNADGTPYQPLLGTRSFENAEARPQITNQWGVSNDLRWEIGALTLTSISAYRYQDFDIKNGGNTRFYINNGGQQLWNDQISQELRLTSQPGNRLDYQVGVYYLNAEVYSDDPDYNGQDAGAWYASNSQYNTLIGTPSGRELLRYSLDGMYQSIVTDARVKSFAAYGQTDWHITDQATLTLGLRQTHERKTNQVRLELDRPGIPLTAEFFPTATPAELNAANAVRGRRIDAPYDWHQGRPIEDDLTAWNIGQSHKLGENMLVYASAGEGVKSGFIYFNPNLDPTLPRFETSIHPEKSRDYEFGVKSLLLGRRLQLNVNVYQTEVTDYQTSFTTIEDDGQTVLTEWTNAPGVKARGMEFESAYRFNRELSFSLSGAYNRTTFESEWLVAKPEVDTSLPAYSGANVRNGFNDLDGRQIHNAPRVTLSFGMNYEAPLFGYRGRVTLNDSYRSGTYLNANQAQFTYQDSYHITNLGLGVGTEDGAYEIALIGKNIFDKFYATSKSTYSASGASSLQLGAPRYWEIAFRARL
jgi:iron complex outermembrane recepter protein